MHIDGAKTKFIDQNQRQFNGGMVPFELHMNANCLIESIRVHNKTDNDAQ